VINAKFQNDIARMLPHGTLVSETFFDVKVGNENYSAKFKC